jgi:hypothetical protein
MPSNLLATPISPRAPRFSGENRHLALPPRARLALPHSPPPPPDSRRKAAPPPPPRRRGAAPPPTPIGLSLSSLPIGLSLSPDTDRGDGAGARPHAAAAAALPLLRRLLLVRPHAPGVRLGPCAGDADLGFPAAATRRPWAQQRRRQSSPAMERGDLACCSPPSTPCSMASSRRSALARVTDETLGACSHDLTGLVALDVVLFN